MKLIETLTIQNKIDLLNGNIVGIFKSIFSANDKFYSQVPNMCSEYYLNWSGEKTISPIYEKTVDLLSEQTSIARNAEEIIGSNIRARFIDKWNRVYAVLVEETYKPLDDYVDSETKSGNNKDTTTYGSKTDYSSDNNNTITYNLNTTDNGKTGTKEVTTRNVENDDNVYGFNSTYPVGDTFGQQTTSETVSGDAESNTNFNEQLKTGTETKKSDNIESTQKSGTDSKQNDYNETITHNGRRMSGADLVESEISLRDRRNFFEMIFRDIDSITTIQLYN